MRTRPTPFRAAVGIACTFIASTLGAQASTSKEAGANLPAWLAADRATLNTEVYTQPSEGIAKLVTAPRQLNVALTQQSPNRTLFLQEQVDGLPTVNTFGKPHYYLGGLQVDYKANRVRALTTRGASGLQLIDARTGKGIDIAAPKGATISGSAWSPDSRQLAYLANFDDATQLFVADVATGKSVQVSKTPLLATLVTSVDWTADGKSVVVVQIPDGRKSEPKRPDIATGPVVRTWTDGVKDGERNFASLLQDPYDQALLEYYTTGQIALIDVRTKVARRIGAPAMISAVDASPDGQLFRVTTMQKPFSYVTPYSSFGTDEQLWDARGTVLATIRKRPVRLGNDTTGGGRSGRGGPESKRGLAWMPAGAGLYYVERVPSARGDSSAGNAPPAGAGRAGGRGGVGGPRPDRLVQWLPPFGTADTKVLYTADGPMTNVMLTDDAKTVFVASAAANNGMGELYAVYLGESPVKRMSIVRQRGYTPTFAGGSGGRGGRGGAPGGGRGGAADDSLTFYNNPGAMLTKRGTFGGQVALVSADGAVFLQGTQYFRDYLQNAPREFVDKIDIKSGTKARVFEGAKDGFEAVSAALDDDLSKVVVTRETPAQVPDAFLRDTKSGTTTKLTNNVDYAPEFTNLVRKRITVTRADGIHFLVRLTLPAGYQTGTRLPGMFWFYPYEYTDQAGYERTLRTENVNRFPAAGPRTIEYLATQGYAVANFDPPIVGDAGRMNDNYVSDLVMNLSAVIDELDTEGFIDRQRLGIGGHSYGAFSTMNAMTHVPFFKAGIAGDGMYNRTLTPTGFQSERRDLWSGQKTYLDMSPMLVADKLQGAILMYHSIEDQNVGTDPISSIRMMQALRANGKTASLYMYPYEDHGPATKETMLDQWARWTAWLDIYVKHAGDPALQHTAATPATAIVP